MSKKTNEINKILKIKNNYDAPKRLWQVLKNRSEREQVFKEMLELFDYRLDIDWLGDYYQETLADKKDQGQVFSPPHTTQLMSQLLGIENCSPVVEKGIILEPCSGTGRMSISYWNVARKTNDYKPEDYRFICEELSEQLIPFLVFNLAIRGINAVVVHCNTVTRKSFGAFLISNKENNPNHFSIINRVAYDEHSEKILGVKFTTKLYPAHEEL